ncbi:ferripyoverdine/pyocin S3 receptor FpvA [Verticiella sediminum]
MAGAVWLALSCALSASAAHAAEAAPAAGRGAAAQAFQIPPGPLGPALSQFAGAAGIVLSFDAQLTDGRRTPGLSGRYTVEQGLDALLAGSGLRATRDTRGNYGLQAAPASAAPAAGAVAQLGSIEVTGNQLGDITEGTGSYTSGTIATSTRIVLTPRETPQSLSVVTRQEMDDFNLTSIDKVMEHTPGVTITTFDSERTVYWSRGFAINNFQYDGIPMQRNSAYSAGNTLSDMAIYDRVEVLKGATGLLTGAGDPGATINLVRKRPTREFQGHVSAGVGTYDTYRGELDVSGPLNASGSVRARAVAAYEDKHSHLDNYRRRTPVFYGVLEADLTSDTLLTIGADYQNNTPRGSTWGGIPLFDSEGNFNRTSRSYSPAARWSNWEQYTRTAFATLEHNFANDWVVKLQLNHQINGYDAQLGSIGAGNPNPADGSGTSLWLGEYIGKTVSDAADVYASGPFELFGRKHELVLGGSIAKRHWTNTGYGPGAYDGTVADFYGWNGDVPEPVWSAPYENEETTHERGVYAAGRWNLRDDLKVITGGRWARYRNAEQGQDESGVFVPYAGVVYDLNRNFSLYGSYTGIFNPQSAQDEAGRTLDPLEGKSLEAGMKAEFFDGRVNGSLAYFRIKQDNYAEATGGTTPSGGVAYRAVDGVTTRGFEATLSGEVLPNWQVHAGYTHQVSRLDSERVSTEDPSNQFSLYTTYRLSGALRGLTLGGGARWQGKTWADVSNPVHGTVEHRMASRWLFDAMARYEFDRHLSATLSVENLFDKKYYTLMSFYNTYSWGTPRTVLLNLRYQF